LTSAGTFLHHLNLVVHQFSLKS